MNWSGLGISSIVTFTLAAMLGPAIFGIVTVSLILIMLARHIATLGMTIPLVQTPDISRLELASAFWTLVVSGAFVVAIICACAGYWGVLNGDALVVDVVRALSPLIFIHVIAVVPRSILTRSLDFRSLARINATAAGIGGVIAVAMVYSEMGVWSIVALHLVTEIVAAILIWRVSKFGITWEWSYENMLRLWKVGSGALLGQLSAFTNASGDAAIIGMFVGPVVAGLYRLSNRFVQLLITLGTRSVAGFTLPYLSNLQSDPQAFSQRVNRCLFLSGLLSLPAMGIVFGQADLLALCMGEAWRPAGISIQMLSIVGAVHATLLLAPQVLNSLGKSYVSAAFSWTLAFFSISSFIVAGNFAIGKPLEEQLAIMSGSRAGVALIIALPLNILLFSRVLGISVWGQFKTTAKLWSYGVLAAIVSLMITNCDPLEGHNLIVRLAGYSLSTAVIVAIALFATSKEFREEWQNFAEYRKNSSRR